MLEGETLVSGIQRGTLWHDGLYNVAKRSVYIRGVPVVIFVYWLFPAMGRLEVGTRSFWGRK